MMSEWMRHVRNRAGYTVAETLTSIAICGVLAAAALPHLDTRRTDLRTTITQVIGDYRWARTRAITGGVHFSVEWLSGSRYQVKRLKQDGTGTWVLDQVVKDVMIPSNIIRWGWPAAAEFNTRGLMVGAPDVGVWQNFVDTQYGATVMLGIWPSGQTYLMS
jgi:hypothetical protein